MKAKYDEPLSDLAFNCNLRPFNWEWPKNYKAEAGSKVEFGHLHDKK